MMSVGQDLTPEVKNAFFSMELHGWYADESIDPEKYFPEIKEKGYLDSNGHLTDKGHELFSFLYWQSKREV